MSTEPKKSTQIKSAKILLHTSLGVKVFTGNTIGPVGVFKFAGLVHRIWQAADADDPYADLFLLRIYDSIKQTRRELQQVENEYKKYLTSESGVALEPLVDEEPLSIPLHFHTPYGFMGAYLLADFDRFIRLMISIRHYALMSDKEILTVVQDLNRKVRRALSEPLQWKSTGVTREDIKLKTDKADLALAAMGRISEAVLSKKIAPPFSPKPVLNRPLLRS